MLHVQSARQALHAHQARRAQRAQRTRRVRRAQRMRRVRRVLIMGAAGRDFHNFNIVYRNNPAYNVVAFTAAQIPGIAGRQYPRTLAGRAYPRGIPIYDERELPQLIKRLRVDEVILAYSDLSHEEVMHKASLALASGADFTLLGPNSTTLKSRKPVVAITAVRTGAGKSPVTRALLDLLKDRGLRPVVVRHPMPYRQLEKQACERFASRNDLKNCTIEEREEIEPIVEKGFVVYAGIDYEEILKRAEREGDVIVWDGGNNDLPFFKPMLQIVVFDALRAGHELRYHPGEANARLAHIAIINKVGAAQKDDIALVKANIRSLNPKALIVESDLEIVIDRPELVHGGVLCIEDGPTLTHGGTSIGAGYLAARRCGATPIDPRPYAVGSIKKTFEEWPQIGAVLPAMGYSKKQIRELEATIAATPCNCVLIATPTNLSNVLRINKPVAFVRYELSGASKRSLSKALEKLPMWRRLQRLSS